MKASSLAVRAAGTFDSCPWVKTPTYCKSVYGLNMKMRNGLGGKKERSKQCNQPSFLLVASGPVGPLARAQIVLACNMPTVELFVTDVKPWQKFFLHGSGRMAQLPSQCSSYHLCEHLEMAVATLLCVHYYQLTDVS